MEQAKQGLTAAQRAATAMAGGVSARVRHILSLALPIIGGMLSQNLLNLVDTAMVGRLGAPALAAVGFGGMVNWLAAAFFYGLGSGVQSIAARRIGAENPRGAVSALHTALLVAWLVVLPYGVLAGLFTHSVFSVLSDDPAVIAAGVPYLRIRLAAMVFGVSHYAFRGYWNGIGRTTVYLRTVALIHGVNVLLNWVLIYGKLGAPALGVRGAAWASAISLLVGFATYTRLGWRYARVHGFMSRSRDREPMLRGVLRLSVPAGVQNIVFSAGFVAFFRVAQMLGTQQLAATNVLLNLALVCVLPSLGFGMASATLVGQALGAKSYPQAKCWGWTTLFVAIAVMFVLGSLLALFPEFWLSLLMKDAAVERAAVVPLVLLGLFQPVDAVGSVLAQALIGAGAVRSVMAVGIVLQWLIFLPSAYMIARSSVASLLALWIAFGLWRGAVSIVLAVIFARGNWAKIRV